MDLLDIYFFQSVDIERYQEKIKITGWSERCNRWGKFYQRPQISGVELGCGESIKDLLTLVFWGSVLGVS